MSKTEINKIDDTDAKNSRKDLAKAAIVIGTHVVLPVALTVAAVIVSRKIEASK